MSAAREDPGTVATPPPAVSVARAMLWNWWIVLLAVLVCAGAGAGYALLREPEYKATARLAVGRIDITSPGALSGYAVATQALATGYSRTVSARAVAKQVSAETGIPVDEVQDHVTGTPVPDSPVFKVEATSPDADQAVRLANLSGGALIRYATKLNQDNPDSGRLYRKFRAASLERQLAKQRLTAARNVAEEEPNPATRADLAEAKSRFVSVNLRTTALSKAYTASVQSQASTQLIQVISPAAKASSDRRSVFLIMVFIGAVAGVLVGGTIAYLREVRLRPED